MKESLTKLLKRLELEILESRADVPPFRIIDNSPYLKNNKKENENNNL